MLDFNAPIGDDVWLFLALLRLSQPPLSMPDGTLRLHGQLVESFAAEHGVAVADLLPEYLALGSQRHDLSEASCATGWQLSASYARRGPEYLYFAKGGLATLRGDGAGWVEPASPADRAAVFIIRISWALLNELDAGKRRDQMLPDSARWGGRDLLEQLHRVPGEVVVPGGVLVDHLVAVHWVRTDCDCSGTLQLTAGASNHLADSRLRCEQCFIAEELIARGPRPV